MPELPEAAQWKVTEVLEPTPEPFFVNEERGIRLYQGDALAMLRQSRSEKFDVIFADPPYFLSNGGMTCQSGPMVSFNNGKWDDSGFSHGA